MSNAFPKLRVFVFVQRVSGEAQFPSHGDVLSARTSVSNAQQCGYENMWSLPLEIPQDTAGVLLSHGRSAKQRQLGTDSLLSYTYRTVFLSSDGIWGASTNCRHLSGRWRKQLKPLLVSQTRLRGLHT